jgi:hypothetical protein
MSMSAPVLRFLITQGIELAGRQSMHLNRSFFFSCGSVLLAIATSALIIGCGDDGAPASTRSAEADIVLTAEGEAKDDKKADRKRDDREGTRTQDDNTRQKAGTCPPAVPNGSAEDWARWRAELDACVRQAKTTTTGGTATASASSSGSASASASANGCVVSVQCVNDVCTCNGGPCPKDGAFEPCK